LTDEPALLRSLGANPIGDAARMVYADWLDEHARPTEAALQRVLAEPDSDARRLEYAQACEWRGGPGDAARAEFIRVQVELARRTESADGADPAHRRVCRNRECRVCHLRRRERELLPDRGGNARAWFDGPWRAAALDPLASSVLGSIVSAGKGAWPQPQSGMRYRFARGFVESITCTAAEWFAHGDAVRAYQPLRKVTLTTDPEALLAAGLGADPRVLLRDRPMPPGSPEPAPGDRVAPLSVLQTAWPGIGFEVLALPGLTE
jgi:uncharacterized protein (TIGR02996 family)